MKALKSITGAAFAALYAMAFVAAYVDYRHHIGQWFADTGVILVALPFVLTMRFLSGGSFDMSGDDGLKLVAAVVFCCALVWIVGALLEWLLRAAFRRLRGRPSA